MIRLYYVSIQDMQKTGQSIITQTVINQNYHQLLQSHMAHKLKYTPLEILKQQRTAVTQTAQSKHWKQFKVEHTSTFKNAVSNVSSCLNEKNDIFFSSGRQLSIYSTTSKSILNTISTFTDNISTISVRKDGLLFAVGLESGRIQVMDVKNKLSLRTFTNHVKRVNAIQYANVNELYSTGDDKIIRQYDVAANAVIHSFPNAHEDYIKCLGYLGDNHIVSGGYDNKIKVFDFRVHKQKVQKFDHGLPVQSLAILPSKLSFASVGGTSLKVWDIRANKLMFENLNNKKTLTSVKVLSDGDRILTGGLDQQLKIYNTITLQVTYQQKYQDSIASFDVSNNSKNFAVGLNNGQLIIKGMSTALTEETSDVENDLPAGWKFQQQKTTAYNNSYFYRGIYQQPEQDHYVVQNISKKTGFYDKCLKKFQYKKAIISAVTKNQMHILHSLVQQLKQRGILQRTLKHLEVNEVRLILKLVIHRIHTHKYRGIVLEMLQIVYELHSKSCGELKEWKQLLDVVDKQIQVEQELTEQLGMLQAIGNICLY